MMKKLLIAQMRRIQIKRSEFDHIGVALASQNDLKIYCGMIALERGMSEIFH